MDPEKAPEPSDDVDGERNSAEINGEESHGEDTMTPKIAEPGPSGNENLNPGGWHAARAKEKGHNRTRSSSRRSWKYPNGPPVPQPNQEPLTLEQCLRVTERDLFKRHEYHKTSMAQKEIYIQYLKFLIETSGRLLYPPGPLPRPPALCPTSFGSEFSQFLTDVRYDGNDNIRWIPHRVATPKIDAGRNEGSEQPEGLTGAKNGTESNDQERQPASGNDVRDAQEEEPITQHQEPCSIQDIHPEENQDSSQPELHKRDTPQAGHGPSPDGVAFHGMIAKNSASEVSLLQESAKEGDGEQEGVTVTLPEITQISPAIPTEDPVTSASEIQGPVPTGRSQRSLVLGSERIGEAGRLQSPESKLQGEIASLQRPKSRGISGSVLPIPYQSNQERLWLKYHEMQLHFDAEIDEMDSRIEFLKKHLIRVGGSINANGVARAGSSVNSEEKDQNVEGGALETKATDIGGVWLRGVRQTIDKLKEIAPGPGRTPRPNNSKIGQPTRVIALPAAANPTEPGVSVDTSGLPRTLNASMTTKGTSRACTLDGLPYEILSAILECLPLHSQATLSVTCRLWHQIMTPMVWKNVFLDEQVDEMVGRRRAYRELKRIVASNDEKDEGKQNPSVQTFWPIACLTVQTSIPNDNEVDSAESQEPLNRAEDARPSDDEDWWKRGPPKPARKPSNDACIDVPMTARDKAISYNESLALMPITMGILRALGNPKLAMHVRTLYASIDIVPWPIEGGQDIALAGDLIRHLRGLRAQTMRQMLLLIKKAVRNLARVDDLVIKSHNSKISSALLGILGWSPKLSILQLVEVDLRTCQFSRGRGKGQAYEVLKRIIEESGDTEEVKQEQIKVVDQLHTENGWMHCPSPVVKEGDSAKAAAQNCEEQKNGLQENPKVSDAQGSSEDGDRTASSICSGGKQKENNLDTIVASVQENEEQTEGAEKPPVTPPPSQGSGKGRDDNKTAITTLTSSEWRQKLSRESMNYACWNPIEMAAFDAGSIQGSFTGSDTDPRLQLTRKHRQPPARKRRDGSYFYPSLTHLTLQGCKYHGLALVSSSTFPNRPKPLPRKAIRATVALRRFLTRCPNLEYLTIRDCTIQPEALFDFGSPRRAVWWKSIFAQTLMETGFNPGGSLFMTEMQFVVEVPFEADSHGDGEQQPQLLPPSSSSSAQIPGGGGSSSVASAENAGAAAEQSLEASSSKEKTGDNRNKQLMETVWKKLRDNNNRLLTFPNLKIVNIDCGTFLRPEVPYRWISSPGFEDFFLRHRKISRLAWDGYILSRHLSPTNPTFLNVTHHLGQTLKTLILNHVDCQNSPPHQVPPAAAHLKAFSFPRLNAMLRALKALQRVDIFVDLMPTSQMVGIARALKGKNITTLSLGRARGVLGPAEVDVLVDCLPGIEQLCVSRWRPADFVYAFPVIRIDPPGLGELAYEEDEEFPTQEEGEEIPWFSVAELATKLSHLHNLTAISLNYTFPIPLIPPLPTPHNEIFHTLCDDTYRTPSQLLTLSTTPGTTQSVWIREYLNAVRTTAEVFASTPGLSKLMTVTLGYFVHDYQSKGSVSILRDEEGIPVSWECFRFPEFVWRVLDAHEVEYVRGPLRPANVGDDETTAKE